MGFFDVLGDLSPIGPLANNLVSGVGSGLNKVGLPLGFGGNDPSNGMFDPNDPRFQTDASGQYRQSLIDAINQAKGQAPVQMDTTQSDQSRQQLMDAIAGIRGQANGTAPSVAQNELYQNTNRAIGQLAGATAANRGLNPAMAARMIQNNGADIMQNANNQASLLRAQETNTAQNNLVNALGALRGQDINQAGTNANLGLQSRSLADTLASHYQDLYQQLLTGNQAAALTLGGYNNQYSMGQNQNASKLLGGAMNGASSMMSSGSMGGGAAAAM